jgi:BirA family biotin operon repressor/biotin-[acetyl-CoA-carboxylase] ligase
MTSEIIEQLDLNIIKMAVEPQHQLRLTCLEIFETLGSTNDYLAEQAKIKPQSGWVCFAEQQTQGKGRRGRAWFSPRGANLYCSILWQFPAQQTDLPALSIAVAVMVVSGLKKYGVQAGLELKWPNDILFAGRKLSGILLECLPEQQGYIPVVIGVGLNLCFPRESLPADVARWIDLAEITGQPVRRNYLAGLLVNEFVAKLPVYQAQGLKAFMSDWRLHDILFGKNIVIHTALETIPGVMDGVTEKGELQLKMLQGEVKLFQCGEVSVR